jgi:ParB family transcriptional regulator, chromosome partitioning protein
MTLKTVALSALCPSKDNPRRHIDQDAIAGLADSIKTDGVLQNLVVEKNGDGKFRVVSGSRRFLALKLLKRQGVIDGDYKVPVEIRKFEDGDALRIATIENVQRSDLEPIDEAEAFARMLQNGASIDDVSAKTGLSEQTIRRRVALADLCDEVKDSVQKGEVPLGIAEAMTLGTHEQQRSLLSDLREGAELDRDTIRDMLCAQKPSVAIALFPAEQYTGTLTRDLFAEEDATYFDDIDQFFTLQKEAVEALAEKHRKKAAWVDVLNTYSVPWWQYGEKRKGKRGGVVINLHPTGRVEVRKGLVRHQVKQEVVEATKEAPEAPKERPENSAGLIRYAALHKSIAVQAALLQNPRKAKEVAAVCLLLGLLPSKRLRIDVHPCFTAWDAVEKKPKALTSALSELSRVSRVLGIEFDVRTRPSIADGSSETPVALYRAVQVLSEDDLDKLSVMLVLLSFGQSSIDVFDTDESLFNRVATDLQLPIRAWWMPDAEFLALLRKDQLEAVAIESGASLRMAKLKSYGKKELVDALVQYFARTADPATTLDEHDEKGRTWLPAAMSFRPQAK